MAENVRRNVKAFMPGGGYVFNNVHNIQGEVPPENVVALFDTANQRRVLRLSARLQTGFRSVIAVLTRMGNLRCKQ